MIYLSKGGPVPIRTIRGSAPIHIFWFFFMGLGHNDPCLGRVTHKISNRSGVKSHLGVNDLWLVICKIDHCIHNSTYIYIYAGTRWQPFQKLNIDVFSWDLDTMILGYSHTCDLNRCGVKGHLGVNDLCSSFCQKGHCIHILWCTFMGLAHNDPWVESHM